jgi:3-hydroxybutyryl-CoA dehydrogenase
MGLDTVLAELEKYQAMFGERFRPARLLKAKVRAGHLGKKVGRGFFEYTT